MVVESREGKYVSKRRRINEILLSQLLVSFCNHEASFLAKFGF